MRTPDYTPSDVARTLRDPSSDRDLAIDLERVAKQLDPTERAFLAAWIQGYSPTKALIQAGLKDDHQGPRRLGALLRKLTHLLNEGSAP